MIIVTHHKKRGNLCLYSNSWYCNKSKWSKCLLYWRSSRRQFTLPSKKEKVHLIGRIHWLVKWFVSKYIFLFLPLSLCVSLLLLLSVNNFLLKQIETKRKTIELHHICYPILRHQYNPRYHHLIQHLVFVQHRLMKEISHCIRMRKISMDWWIRHVFHIHIRIIINHQYLLLMVIHQHQHMALALVSMTKYLHLVVTISSSKNKILLMSKSIYLCWIDTSRTPYSYIHTTKRSDPNIDVKLENMDLWKRFAELNLEMIITKSGR